MCATYKADIYCDDCADKIKRRIFIELFAGSKFEGGNGEQTPDGSRDISSFDTVDDLSDYLGKMDEREYDSGEYPKYCSGSEAADSPLHCGDCGDFLENPLTTEGEDYVRTTNQHAIACDDDYCLSHEWMDFYNLND